MSVEWITSTNLQDYSVKPMQVKIKSFAMKWLGKGEWTSKSVIQDKVKNKKQQEKVRGTTKSGVLTGNPEAPDLVALVSMTLNLFSRFLCAMCP